MSHTYFYINSEGDKFQKIRTPVAHLEMMALLTRGEDDPELWRNSKTITLPTDKGEKQIKVDSMLFPNGKIFDVRLGGFRQGEVTLSKSEMLMINNPPK